MATAVTQSMPMQSMPMPMQSMPMQSMPLQSFPVQSMAPSMTVTAPIVPSGSPAKDGPVILQLFFKKTETWPKTKNGAKDLSHGAIISEIRADLGPQGPNNIDVRAALVMLSSADGDEAEALVGAWQIGKVVTGKYVMILELIVDECKGMNAAKMVRGWCT